MRVIVRWRETNKSAQIKAKCLEHKTRDSVLKCPVSAQLAKAYIQSCWSVLNDMLMGVNCQLGKEFNMDIPISSVCQDDPPAMDFVTAAANLRMHIFSMNMKSRFDVKCKFSYDSAEGGVYRRSYRSFCA